MNTPMNTVFKRAALALMLAAALPTAHAHRGWLLPSATVLSGNEPWVTVDAAISNDVFFFEHNAMRLDDLIVLAPDGSTVQAENRGQGRYRSTFDVKLTQKGTYKIAVVNNMMTASFKVGTETKRLRGTAESLAKDIPAGATELNVTQANSRTEIFVTSGKPSLQALAPTGVGLEMVPVTHPNDLIVGEPATLRFTLDGKPAAGLNVLVIPGGIRYRDKLGEMRLATDDKGEVRITWPMPGMYWLNASPAREGGDGGGPGMGGAGPQAQAQGQAPAPGQAAAPRPRGPAGTLEKPTRRVNYVSTLEVLAQ